MIVVLALSACVDASAVTLSSQEQSIANSLLGSGQRRDRAKMVLDSRLVQVARARAQDMAKRRYFDHVNPDGFGPNYLVRQTGFVLPSFYSTSRSANNIESIGAGYPNASSAWAGWMGSASHKTHLLATESFYRDQLAYGVGYYYDAGSPYQHYWVVLTAPPSPVQTLSFTSPAAGARVTSPTITVTGMAGAGGGGGTLRYRLENAAGMGEWRSAPVSSGSASAWNVTFANLLPGMNTVRAQLLSGDGAVLKDLTRSFRYAIVKPLTVSVDGVGKVAAGFEGTTLRELGALLTMTARPGPGAIFDRWEGVPGAAEGFYSPRLQVLMVEGLSLTARFIPSPYLGREALYVGVLPGVTHEGSGMLRLQLTGTGELTGSFFFAGKRHSLIGRLDSRGEGIIRIERMGKTPMLLSLAMALDEPLAAIQATVTVEDAVLPVIARRASGMAVTGRSTVYFSPDLSQPQTPQGSGFATVLVGGDGTGIIAGTLANGQTFTAGATVLESGTLVFYRALASGRGSLQGHWTWSADGAVAGELRWHKPRALGALYYPEAFSTSHAVSGARYTPPAVGEAPAGLAEGLLALRIQEEGANFTQPFVVAADVRKPVLTPLQSPVVTLKLQPGTGRFYGTYRHETAGLKPFAGMLAHGQEAEGRGFVLGRETSGAARVEALR